MKRWHLTLLLALLAAGGVALAVTLPAVGIGLVTQGGEVAPVEHPAVIVEAAPLVEPIALVPPIAPIPPIAPVPPIAPAPPIAPTRPLVGHGVHPIHVDQGEHGGLIPELSEPVRRLPVIVELPPDPPSRPDGCPACGMG